MEPHFSAASLYSCSLISQIESLMFRIWMPKQGSLRSFRMPFGSPVSSLFAIRFFPVFSVSQGFALALPCSFSGSSDEPPSRAFFYPKPLFAENSSFHHPWVRVL